MFLAAEKVFETIWGWTRRGGGAEYRHLRVGVIQRAAVGSYLVL